MSIWDIVGAVVDPAGALTKAIVDRLPKIAGIPGIPTPVLYDAVTQFGNHTDDLLNYIKLGTISPQLAEIATVYLTSLETQAIGHYKSIPEPLKRLLRPHYNVNLDEARYAEKINTIHGQAITVDNHLFFPQSIDLTTFGDIRWLAHELQHFVQCRAL